MALEDIVFDVGDERGIIVEIDAANYSGVLSDIHSEADTTDGPLVTELVRAPLIINNARLVR